LQPNTVSPNLSPIKKCKEQHEAALSKKLSPIGKKSRCTKGDRSPKHATTAEPSQNALQLTQASEHICVSPRSDKGTSSLPCQLSSMGQLLIDGSSAINSNAVNESVQLAVPSPQLSERTNVDRAHQLSSEPSSTDGSPAVSSIAVDEPVQHSLPSPRLNERTTVNAHQLSSGLLSIDRSPAVSSITMGAASESLQPAVLSPRVDEWRSISLQNQPSSMCWGLSSTDAPSSISTVDLAATGEPATGTFDMTATGEPTQSTPLLSCISEWINVGRPHQQFSPGPSLADWHSAVSNLAVAAAVERRPPCDINEASAVSSTAMSAIYQIPSVNDSSVADRQRWGTNPSHAARFSTEPQFAEMLGHVGLQAMHTVYGIQNSDSLTCMQSNCIQSSAVCNTVEDCESQLQSPCDVSSLKPAINMSSPVKCDTITTPPGIIDVTVLDR
jgi:hypothetical protein